MNKPPIIFIAGKQRKELLEKLKYYGIDELPQYILTESGKEKIRAYSGSLSMEQIRELNKEIGVELIGMYLLHNYLNNIRLAFDAVAALKSQIKENILELNDEQAQEFLKGRDVALSKEEQEKLKSQGEQLGFKIFRHKEDLLGTGKLTQEGRLVNYMPKERRIK